MRDDHGRDVGGDGVSAYYNEIDRFAAAWLRELIKRNLIAPGEVDERSIADVRPDDLVGFDQVHFFAGIGVWSYALRQAGWPDDRPVWTGSCPCQPFSCAVMSRNISGQRWRLSSTPPRFPANENSRAAGVVVVALWCAMIMAAMWVATA